MAFKLAEIFTELTVKDGKFRSGIGRARSKLKDLGISATNVAAGVTAAVAGIGALSFKFAKLAAVQEEAEIRVRIALQATGQEVENNDKKLKDLASTLQKQTAVGDEVLLQTMAMGINMGGTADKMEEATKGAIGLSKAFGIDMNMAMRGVILAQQGEFNLLNRYIPALRTAETETEKMAALTETMAMGFAVAEGSSGTFNFQLDSLNNELGDMGETIGREIIPPMLEIVSIFRDDLSKKPPGLKFIREMFEGIAISIDAANTAAKFFSNTLDAVENAMPDFLKGQATGLTKLALNPLGTITEAVTQPFMDTGAAPQAVGKNNERILAEIARNTAKTAVTE